MQGHVQGVFFRETTRRRALADGVAGWVRNLPDGSVEALFEGEREAVDRLVGFCATARGARASTGSTSSTRGAGGAHRLRRPLAGYSHSIVAGGFELMSSATRLTPGISLMIRLEIVSSRSYGRRAQSAVIASSEVTARITIG